MPSPTDSTWPTSVTSASAPKFWICCLRIAEISAARISIGKPHLRFGLFPEKRPEPPHGPSGSVAHGQPDRVELRAQRGVDHAAAELHDHAADQARVDLHVEMDLSPRGL